MDIEVRVGAWLAQQDVEAYLVGGCVRDRLLWRHVADLDVVTAGDGLILARCLADSLGGKYYPLDQDRSTGRAILPGGGGRRLVVDVAQFRGGSLAADLADRDFTINALAVDVRAPNEVIDHYNGMADLAEGLIRPISDDSIRNDPLRAMRAVRQAAQLGFALAPETRQLVWRDGDGLAQVSGERVRDELARLLVLPDASPYLILLDELGLLTVVLPELEALRNLEQPAPHHCDVFGHSLETVQALEVLLRAVQTWVDGARGSLDPELPDHLFRSFLSRFSRNLDVHFRRVMSDTRRRLVALKLAALLHDTGKPTACAVNMDGRVCFAGHQEVGARSTVWALRRLRFSSGEVRLGEIIVRHHMRPLLLAKAANVTARAIYRFFRDTGDAGIDVLFHALADHQAVYGLDAEDEGWANLVALTARMMGDYWERQSERVKPARVIDGHDLLREFGLRPGPQIGELLEVVREAQVSGEVHSRQDALRLVRARLAGESQS
jgi:tRNA nucleotidyltransferase/poly(A) polymerase